MLKLNHRHSTPLTPGTWSVRLLTALCFAFYVNYIPVHLATATHFNDAVEALLHSVSHSHGHEHEQAASASNKSGHQHPHHTPHPSSDHALVLQSQNQSTAVVAETVFLPEEALSVPTPQAERASPLVQRIKPPGESPPDPARPRAPPIA